MRDIPMKNKLDGKLATVTGGASGIGEATTRNFINQGARAVVIADIQDEKGQNVAASICSERCTYIHCDVTDEEQVNSLVESTASMYGHLDVMFSNAGIFSSGTQTVLDFNLSAFDKLFAANTRGMAACVKHAARAMKEGGMRRSIICTASASATRDFGFGTVGTPLLRRSFGVEMEEVEKVVKSRSKLKGVLKEKNVAETVAFLASDESEFVTGIDLAVDGLYVFPL